MLRASRCVVRAPSVDPNGDECAAGRLWHAGRIVMAIAFQQVNRSALPALLQAGWRPVAHLVLAPRAVGH